MERPLKYHVGAGLLALTALLAAPRAEAQLAEFRSVPTVEDFLAILAPERASMGELANRSEITWREIRDEPLLPGASAPSAQRPPRAPSPAAPPPAAPAARPPRTPATTAPTAIAMPDVFELNSAALPPNTIAMLDNLALAMVRAPGTQVRITGHTDSTGPVAFNDALSQRRAEAALRHLTVRRGIDVGRVRVEGMGPRQPIEGLPTTAPNNRRIQVWGAPR